MKTIMTTSRQISPRSVSTAALKGKLLDVPQIHQQTLNWCWAACIEMVLNHFGHDLPQREIAERYIQYLKKLGKPHQPNPKLQQCKVADLSRVLAMSGIKSKYDERDIAFSTVQEELNAGRPVIAWLEWFGGQDGHLVVIRGWHRARGEGVLTVNNPERGTGIQTYTDLVMAYGQGTWKSTWLNLTPAKQH